MTNFLQIYKTFTAIAKIKFLQYFLLTNWIELICFFQPLEFCFERSFAIQDPKKISD